MSPWATLAFRWSTVIALSPRSHPKREGRCWTRPRLRNKSSDNVGPADIDYYIVNIGYIVHIVYIVYIEAAPCRAPHPNPSCGTLVDNNNNNQQHNNQKQYKLG